MMEQRSRLLWEFAGGFHRSQAKTIVAVVAAPLGCGQVRSVAIGQRLAQSRGTRFKSGLWRF